MTTVASCEISLFCECQKVHTPDLKIFEAPGLCLKTLQRGSPYSQPMQGVTCGSSGTSVFSPGSVFSPKTGTSAGGPHTWWPRCHAAGHHATSDQVTAFPISKHQSWVALSGRPHLPTGYLRFRTQHPFRPIIYIRHGDCTRVPPSLSLRLVSVVLATWAAEELSQIDSAAERRLID